MLFIHTWQLVVEGKKTLTTRLAQKGASGEYECRYVAGRTYGVQMKYRGRSIARIQILSVKFRDHAGDISDADAQAEGFQTAQEFRDTYSKAYSKKSLERPAFGIRFNLVERLK
jgi:hypothetical protein